MKMRFPPVPELTFSEVTDPGIPNKERLNIRVVEPLNLAPYGLLVGLALADGTAMPFWDQLFWFGAIDVPADSWIVLYTGPGQLRVERDSKTGWPIYIFHWNKPNVVFTSTNTVPILFQIGSLIIGKNAGAPHKESPPEPKAPPSLAALSGENPVASKSLTGLEDLLRITKKPSPKSAGDLGSILSNIKPKGSK
jgi:hypothetical protein